MDDKIGFRDKSESKGIIESTEKRMEELCRLLIVNNSEFQPSDVIPILDELIKNEERLLYSSISNYVFECTNKNYEYGTIESNVSSLIEAVVEKEDDDKEKKKKIRNMTIKIYDHITLARRQFQSLREDKEEKKKDFEEMIAPVKMDVERDMSTQLITLVGIFTALAFLVFGGISSLDNIFSGLVGSVPITELMIVSSIWGLSMLNLLFIFMFCIGKMTKLTFKSREEGSIFQKYPVILFCNAVLLLVFLISSACFLINKWDMLSNAFPWSEKVLQRSVVVLIFIVIAMAIALIYYLAFKDKVETNNGKSVKNTYKDEIESKGKEEKQIKEAEAPREI